MSRTHSRFWGRTRRAAAIAAATLLLPLFPPPATTAAAQPAPNPVAASAFTPTPAAAPAPAPPAPAPDAPLESYLPAAESTVLVDWFADFDAAAKSAAAAKRDILVAFMGVDSGVWSHRLDTEVFSHPAFAAAVAGKFICVFLDFPRTYRLPDKERAANEALRRRWDVGTLPTLILADSSGRPYAITGYRQTDAAAYAAHLLALQSARERRDQFFAAAAAAGTDAEHAAQLANGLREMDEQILQRHYRAELATLKRVDPQDSTGLLADLDFVPKIKALRNEVFRQIRQRKNSAAALDAVDKFIAKNAPTGEHLQRTLFLKLAVYGGGGSRDHAAVLRLMNQIIALGQGTEQGRMAAEVRARARALLDAEQKRAAEQRKAAKAAKPVEKKPSPPTPSTPPAPPKTPPAPKKT
ncbi:MAG: thioredoxin family protein [Puniceicoccales bacterium]|jgi:hypothetical protein|nr:thioredoxin family protein [Puniceicoccales bacterium]